MKLVDISPEGLLSRPVWSDLNNAEEGDILINNRKIVGIVFHRSLSDKIDFCYKDKSSGVMYIQCFYKDTPKKIRFEGDIERAALSYKHPANDRSNVSDYAFEKAQAIYRRTFERKEVLEHERA